MKNSSRMSRTIILGLLAEGQMHGYEIRKRLTDELGERADLNFGSIYYGLKKFVAQGWLEHIRDEAVDGNPERSIYRLTRAGRAELARQVEALLTDTSSGLQPLETGLNFISGLPAGRAWQVLSARYAALKANYEAKLAAEPPAGEPLLDRLIREYRLYQLGAEVLWLKNSLPEVQSAAPEAFSRTKSSRRS